MAEVTYYFNAYTTGVWTDPDNIVDGDIGTFGYTSAKKTAQTLTSNSCPATDLGGIVKVELRLFGKGDGNDRIDITPVFTGGNGNPHPTTPVVSPGDWTAYVDITKDPNHPDWSLWSHIQDLDCIINNVAVAKGNTIYCSKVEVRVTYWVPPVSDIDVGSIPMDRTSFNVGGSTRIDKNNPANASGTLHSIKIWANENITGLRVGTFYVISGNTLRCRDSVVIGDVEAGAERTFTGLSITVVEGDYIGYYFSSGRIDDTTIGFLGMWSRTGEYIDPNDETDYAFSDGCATSLYGYGDIEAPPEYIPRHSGTVGVLMI